MKLYNQHKVLQKLVSIFVLVGKSANYAVVSAQLRTNGKNHGMHAFLVQLRDLQTHKPLPGLLKDIFSWENIFKPVLCGFKASQ